MEEQDDSDQGRANPPSPSTRRERFAQRVADREREGLELHRRAQEEADQLIQSARAMRGSCHAVLGDLACRVALLLEVARCDILLLDGTTRAVRYRMHTNAPPSASAHGGTKQLDVGPATVSVQALALPRGRSPIELLRSEDRGDRIYAFMNSPDDAAAIGILCVQSAEQDRLVAVNRILLRAVATRLGGALTEGSFRGWRSAGFEPRQVL